VILCGFAVIVGVLTERRVETNFNRRVALAADDLQRRVGVAVVSDDEGRERYQQSRGPRIDDYVAGENAGIRLIAASGYLIDATAESPDLGPPRKETLEADGWRVETRAIRFDNEIGLAFVQYAQKLSDAQGIIDRVRVLLAVGVLGGAALALMAGLATAERAMSPIAALTAATPAVSRSSSTLTRSP
jgi:hypothetical protein